jgi:hypothetical protein
MSISSTAQALLDQAAHVFGNPAESERIESSNMPQPPAIHQVKRTRPKKAPTEQSGTITNRDLSVQFSPETMASLPPSYSGIQNQTRHKKKVVPPPVESGYQNLADAAMNAVAQQIEETRTAPTHHEQVPSPPRTGATAQALAARKAATAARKAAAAAAAMVEMASQQEVPSLVEDESKAMTVYEPPQPEPVPMPDQVMPYMSDNVNMESVQAALKSSKKVRAPRKTGGSLRALANRASFAAQIATHSALM